MDWLKAGSTDEDREPSPCRASNHFHNPLKTWDIAGLSGYQGPMASGVDAWCANTAPSWDDKNSNVLWATNFTSPSATKTSTSNDYHWDKTRDFYLKALTESSKTERETNFAKTFYGLGHVLHLLQDMAVPAHVRNDFRSHLDNFVNIGFSLPTYWTKNAFENYVELNGSKITTATPVPFKRLTDFWDTAQYRTNLNPSMMDIVMGGLAEYTNANFASDYTLLTERYPLDSPYRFPYPSQADMTRPYLDKWGRPVYRVYLGKTGNGETIQHFATAGRLFFKKHIPNEPVVIEDPVPYLGFDDNCHKDYADKLLPRAVGYSAGLLNYFFRGKLDMTEDGALGYRIQNLSNEEITGGIASFHLFYDEASGNRVELPLSFFDPYGNQITDLRIPLAIAPNTSSTFTVRFTPPAIDPDKFMLVFQGKLGNEENAVTGSIIGRLYFIAMPVDHETRLTLDKQYYTLNLMKGNTLTPIAQSQLPFSLLDDGGYWDFNAYSWTAKESPESLGVPLGTGGPQYMAKHKDTANNRVRFVLNGSYEKEAWSRFIFDPKDENGNTIKTINYVTFTGSPLSTFGAYNGNTGGMQYTDKGIKAILPKLPINPGERYFSTYTGINFYDTFVETPTFNTYNFDGSRDEQNIPKDPDAPKASIVTAYKPDTTDCITISTPSIFGNYVKPGHSNTGLGTSGAKYYTLCPGYAPEEYFSITKCETEDNNCGNSYNPMQGSSNKTVFDLPSNYGSYVRNHINDAGQYYEELYINGQLRETSAPAPDGIKTHYQVLAVYKDTAVIRETNRTSYEKIPLDYTYGHILAIDENRWKQTARYYIYVKGKRHDLIGTTDITTRQLAGNLINRSSTNSVDHMPPVMVDDITGYHIDRIFLSETFDGSNILIAFDEYTYNNGKGLVHTLKYEQYDSDATKRILYYDIPVNEIQGSDHEATRTGRKLLLFRSDGTLKTEIQDPIGLGKTIGSVGILN